MRILIVDDDCQRSHELREYLISCGQSTCELIQVAAHRDAARKLLRAMYFDVMVLDVVLPKRPGDPPSPDVGLTLLFEVRTNPSLKKPERIIGVTAHTADIERFRTRFESACHLIIEAHPRSDAWKARIRHALSYGAASKLSRMTQVARTTVVTIHGIRTHGQWQTRLRHLIARDTDTVRMYSYKFGYFSSLMFLLPWVRKAQVRHLERNLNEALDECGEGNRVIIFCHSFGTYLAVHALESIFARAEKVPLVLLVLSGSVLPHDWDFESFFSRGGKVVNDCGESDYVLWLTNAFVLGTGMAGKIGFLGLHRGRLVNRYFKGGHSHYFRGDQFMEQYWVPLARTPDLPEELDFREEAGSMENLLEAGVLGIGRVKPWLYVAAALLVIVAVLQGFGFKSH